jgi:hypothetical protein
MGARARANRREKQRLSLIRARAELVLLLDGKVNPRLLELDLHKTWNVIQCIKQNGYVPYWSMDEEQKRIVMRTAYGGRP